MKHSKSRSVPSKERQVIFFVVWLIRLIADAIRKKKEKQS